VIFAARRGRQCIDACQFELSFDYVATFRTSPQNTIVLGGNGGWELLRQLHVQIGIEIHNLGDDTRINRNFQPHATLLYDSQCRVSLCRNPWSSPRANLCCYAIVRANVATSMSIVGRGGRQDNGLPRAIKVA
jgi:2'-5' RNA ligase